MPDGFGPTVSAPSRAPAPARSALSVERDWPAWWPFALFAAYAAIAVGLYHGALRGPALFDDVIYLISNPYTAPLSLANLIEIVDPWGPAKLFSANYAPVHLLATALERHIFADDLLGYHLVNVLVHAGNAALLVGLLRAASVPGLAAIGGGLFFLVHPANVEAVAWMSQLKTSGSLGFGLGGLLLLRRSPGLAAALFALSLLTKASGLFALPAAAAWLWADPEARRRDWLWLAGWVAIAGLFAVPQFAAFAHLGAVEVAAFDDPWVQVRTIAAVAARYLVMAPSGFGVSAWQEPPPTLSWLDPWWLAALPMGLLLGWRLSAALRARSLEAAFWLSAAASFGPVSQVFPFATPVADRYLYFILPGLIGGVLLAVLRSSWWLEAGDTPRRALAALAVAVMFWFGWQTAQRATLWQLETRLLLDAAKHYPDGATAHILRARTAAQSGDVDAAVDLLRGAVARGIDHFTSLERDPGLVPLQGTPQFTALIRDMAADWIALAERRGYSTQPELRFLAIAHSRRGEHAEMVRALEGALEAGGPLEETVRAELAEARALLQAEQRARSGGGGGGPLRP